MKHFAIGLFILLPILMFAQKQRGFVKTCGMPNIKGIALEEVSITAEDSANSISTLSAKDGTFSLLFHGKTNGKPIIIKEVYKSKYTPLDDEFCKKTHVFSSYVPLEITMILRTELARIQSETEENIRTNIELSFSKEEKELTRKLSEKEIEIQEYQKQIEELKKKKESTKELIEKMVNEYSRIDFDQLDSLNTKIIESIRSGELIKAEKLIKSKGNIEDRFSRLKANDAIINEDKERIKKDLEKNSQAEVKNNQEKSNLAGDLHNLYTISIQRFKFDSASYYLEKRALIDTTNLDYIIEYAVFVHERMMQFKKAMTYFSLALRHAKSDLDKAFDLNQIGMLKNELDYPLEEISKSYFNALENLFKDESIDLPKDRIASSIFINLGNLQKEGRHYVDAEESYLTGINSIRNICNASNDVYDRLSLAKKITSLGNLRVDMEKYKFGEENLLEALDIYKSIHLNDTLFYYADLINSLNSLGSLNMKVKKPDRAESFFNDAIIKSRSCLKSDSLKYTSILSSCLDNMGKCKLQMNDFDSAELYLKESISLAENLASLKPEGNNHEYAIILNDYAFLKEKANQYSLAEKYYIESLAIRRKLAAEKFEVYDTYLIEVLNQFSAFYMKANHYQKAEELLIESLCTCYQLKYNWADNYDVELLNILQRLSTLSHKKENSTEAEIYQNEALKIKKKLVGKGLKEFETDIPVVIDNEVIKASQLNEKDMLTSDSGNTSTFLGSISYYMILGHNYKAAEYFAIKALNQSPEQTWIKTNLALSLLLQDKFKEAKKIYLELKDQKYPSDETNIFKDIFLQDFDELEQKGITHPDVLKIRTLLAN